jgi:acyl phosphate:glycerol-3-phosphate acyltransferase
MNMLFWMVVGFISGSIPFSLILGKLFAKKDIRTVGDGNPGGANVIKAGGLKIGIPAILLDILKGFVPVLLAKRYGLEGWSLVPVCLAPILGHAFSPFLRFRGGKALGTTAGVWAAMAGLWALPAYGLLASLAVLLQSEDAWSANVGMLGLLIYSVLFVGEPWMVTFTVLNVALIAWKHRHDLARPPRLRPWVNNIFQGRPA